MPSLDDMSYGEYVDLITYSKDTWDNMPLLMSILYRPISESKKDKYKIQPYNGTVDSQVELFKEKITMDIVFGALSFFLRLQLDLLNATLTSSMENLMTKKWSLYATLATLANNDVRNFDEVTRLNIHECLTFLTYKRDLMLVEMENTKKMQKGLV
jgi:hypothetical protein